MRLYTFTLAAPGKFKATLAISGSASLYDLAALINKAVEFDFDHAFGFYDNLKDTYRSVEKYTLFADLGEPEDKEPGVQETRVQDVFRPAKSMCFLFDYGDEWMFKVKCARVEETSAKRKVAKVLKRSGIPPVQYDYSDGDWVGGQDLKKAALRLGAAEDYR